MTGQPDTADVVLPNPYTSEDPILQDEEPNDA